MSSRQARSVKAGTSAEDARAQRMRNTVELRKQKTDDKMKRLRNLDLPGGGNDTLPGGGDGGASVYNSLPFAHCNKRGFNQHAADGKVFCLNALLPPFFHLTW